MIGLADHKDFETNEEQLKAIQTKVRQIFLEPYGKIENFPTNLYITQVFLQMIIITERPDYYKQAGRNVNAIWILDSTANCLLIYENQPGDFFGLKNVFEHILEQKKKAKNKNDAHMEEDTFTKQAASSPNKNGFLKWKEKLFHGKSFQKKMLFYRQNGRPRAIANTAIVIINIIVFLVLSFLGDTTSAQFIYTHGGMYPQSVLIGHEWYRLFTSMFIHIGFLHLLNNMFILFFIGDKLELAVGKTKYILIYLLSGIGGSLLSLGISVLNEQYAVSAGASGAIFGVIGALLWLVVKNKGRFEDLTSKGMAIMIILCLYFGFASTGVDNWCHVGGLISGFLLSVLLYRSKRYR